MYTIQLVLRVIYISWIQHILFSINLKVPSFRVSFAAGYTNRRKKGTQIPVFFHGTVTRQVQIDHYMNYDFHPAAEHDEAFMNLTPL